MSDPPMPGCQLLRRGDGDGAAAPPPGASAPATTSASAPISSASQAASADRVAGVGHAGAPSAAATMCEGAQTSRRPAFSAQSSSVRVAATSKRGSPSAKAQAACSMARRPIRRCASVAAAGCGWRGAEADDDRLPPAGERVAPGRGLRPERQLRREIDHPRPQRGRRRRRPLDGAQPRRRLRQARADDLDAERAGDAVELLDPDEDPHGAAVGEAARRDPLGQRLEQVDPLGRQLVLDRLGDRVVGDHLVDVVVAGPRRGARPRARR